MLRRHMSIISIQRSAYITAEMQVTTLRCPRCISLFQGSIVEQIFGRLMAFESVFRWDSELLSVKQVVIVFVADFVQPLFLSIYLYRTLIVNFGMRCYFFDKPFT